MYSMRKRADTELGGFDRFFRVALSHNSLENYFRTNFAMMQHHKYSLIEIENMVPWERDIYVALLLQYIEEENERIANATKRR